MGFSAAAVAKIRQIVKTVAKFKIGWTRSDTVVSLTNSGDTVGIGTSNPQKALQVQDTSANGAAITIYREDATIVEHNVLGSLFFGGTGDDSTFGNAAAITCAADGGLPSWAPGSDNPGRLVFKTTPSGSAALSERMRIDLDGNVGIGTTSPIAELDVAGKIAITAESSTPAQPSDGDGYLYSKSDGKIYWRSYDLSETALTDAGGGVGWSGPSADVISTTGSVGIGTTGPDTGLMIRQDESTTLTDFTQAVSKAGILINMDYTADAYTPGLYWNTEDNNATKPKGGIYLKETSTGTYLYLGTSNHYATGITTNTIIDPDGNLQIAGSLTAKTKHIFALYASISATPGGGYYMPWVYYTESQTIAAGSLSTMRCTMVAPYDGKFISVSVLSNGSGNAPGSTVIGVHKNNSGTAMETQTVNMAAFNTAYTGTFTSNSFSKGDALHLNLDATDPLDYVTATVVIEYDEST